MLSALLCVKWRLNTGSGFSFARTLRGGKSKWGGGFPRRAMPNRMQQERQRAPPSCFRYVTCKWSTEALTTTLGSQAVALTLLVPPGPAVCHIRHELLASHGSELVFAW